MVISMKKLTLLIARKDFDNVLREIIHLGCVEVSEPDKLLEDPELASLVKRENFELDTYDTNRENLVLLGTHYTLLLTGWTPSQSEPNLTSILSNYICAWEFKDLSPGEKEIAPVRLCCPKFFRKFRLAGRKEFEPLATKDQLSEGNDFRNE